MTLSAHPSPSAEAADGYVRVLEERDLAGLRSLLNRNPAAYCVVSERVETGMLNPAFSGGQTWGWFESGVLKSAIYVGANLIPIELIPAARRAFAGRLNRFGRRSSAIVGFSDEVLALWKLIGNRWGQCREVRADQPLMVIDSDPLVRPNSWVRLVESEELDILFPAAVAMFEEEVGVSPTAGGRSEPYRARVGQSVRSRRSYAYIHGGEVLFKAEVGAVSAMSCQIQGVWVAPRLRGTGLAAPGTAAVVALARQDHAPQVSLYANAHNAAALRTYARVGFRQIGTFATILF
jgi:uncharacterized protein